MALAGTELEFIVFNATRTRQAWNSHYRDLIPANQYNVDYSILGGSRVEPLLREIRNTMYAAGMNVESAKGECNFGQHEIGFLYADALTTADNHAVYKTAAKQIAAQHGQAITFMAKYNEREGNSCHIHLSLRGEDGSTVGDRAGRPAGDRGRHSRARAPSSPACSRPWRLHPAVRAEHQLVQAFSPGSFAPTTIAWGLDNRTCALRLVGHGPSARLENRLPGGDVNPYLPRGDAGRRTVRDRAGARAGAGAHR